LSTRSVRRDYRFLCAQGFLDAPSTDQVQYAPILQFHHGNPVLNRRAETISLGSISPLSKISCHVPERI
jgi:hypothetical protein